MNKLNPRGYLGRQDWLWWALTLEETLREIEPTQLPKAVLAAYEKWNPNGVEGRSGHFWLTEVAMEQPRVYRIRIILSSVTAYGATFREDGTVVQADPAIIP